MSESAAAMTELTAEQARVVEDLVIQCLDGASLAAVKGYSDEELEALYHVAYELYGQRRYEDAKAVFQFLTLHEHADGRFWFGLGGCCQHLREYESAITAYGCATLVDVTNPVYAFHGGECHMALQDWENAGKAVEAVEFICETLGTGQAHADLLRRARAMKQAVNERLAAQ